MREVRRHKRKAPKKFEEPNLFSGLLYCADCGAPLRRIGHGLKLLISTTISSAVLTATGEKMLAAGSTSARVS